MANKWQEDNERFEKMVDDNSRILVSARDKFDQSMTDQSFVPMVIGDMLLWMENWQKMLNEIKRDRDERPDEKPKRAGGL